MQKLIRAIEEMAGADGRPCRTVLVGELGLIPHWHDAAAALFELFTRAVDGEARAAIRIEIDDTWHLFHKELGPEDALAMPTAIELSCAGVEWGELVWPEPHKAH